MADKDGEFAIRKLDGTLTDKALHQPILGKDDKHTIQLKKRG